MLTSLLAGQCYPGGIPFLTIYHIFFSYLAGSPQASHFHPSLFSKPSYLAESHENLCAFTYLKLSPVPETTAHSRWPELFHTSLTHQVLVYSTRTTKPSPSELREHILSKDTPVLHLSFCYSHSPHLDIIRQVVLNIFLAHACMPMRQ